MAHQWYKTSKEDQALLDQSKAQKESRDERDRVNAEKAPLQMFNNMLQFYNSQYSDARKDAPQMNAAAISPFSSAQNTDMTAAQAMAASAARTSPIRAGSSRASLADAVAANASRINPAQQAQMRGGQQAVLGALAARASGQAPSAAEIMLAANRDRNIADIRSQIASTPGLSPGMAARLASRGISTANTESARQAAALRAQEQSQAEQALLQGLSGARGQDLSLAIEQGRFGQQANVLNAQLAQQAALQNAQLGTQVGMQNAQLGQQARTRSAELEASRRQLNAQLAQQAALQNAAFQQEAASRNAQLGLQANMFNAQQTNQQALQQALLEQQANQANLGAEFQQQAANDALMQYFGNVGLGLGGQQLATQMQRERLASQERIGESQIAAQMAMAGAQRAQQEQAAWLGFGGALAGGAFNLVGHLVH